MGLLISTGRFELADHTTQNIAKLEQSVTQTKLRFSLKPSGVSRWFLKLFVRLDGPQREG